MDRRELAGYVARAVEASGITSTPRTTTDAADALAELDELLGSAPLAPDFDYAPLRESIAIAVCVRLLARRGSPVTYGMLERLAQVVARLPRTGA